MQTWSLSSCTLESSTGNKGWTNDQGNKCKMSAARRCHENGKVGELTGWVIWTSWKLQGKLLEKQGVCVLKSLSGVRLCDPMDCSLLGSPVHGGSSGNNTRVGCHALLEGIFPTRGSSPGLPHCRQILYQLNHQGSPRTLTWVAYSFSRGISWPRNQTRVSCIAGKFFTAELPGKSWSRVGKVSEGRRGESIIYKGPVVGPEGQFGGIKV